MQINKWQRADVAKDAGVKRRTNGKAKDAAGVVESHWILVDGATYALLETKAERAKTTVDALVDRAIDSILRKEGL